MRSGGCGSRGTRRIQNKEGKKKRELENSRKNRKVKRRMRTVE